MAATDIDAAHAERHARTYPGVPEWLVDSVGGLSGLEFETDAVIESVAVGLARGHQYVLMRLGAVRILNGRVHLFEKAQVVETALAFENFMLAQRRAGLNPQFPAGDTEAGVVQAIEKNLVHKKLFAFVNRKGHTYARQVVWRWDGHVGEFHRGIGKTAVEIFFEDRVAIISQARFVEALTFCRRNFGKLLWWKGVTAFDANPRNPRLQPFFDRDRDGELRRIVLIMIDQFAADFRLPETAGAVQILNVLDILFEQGFAVAPVTEEASGRLVLHVGANQSVRKEMIPSDAHGCQFVAVARIYLVNDL